MRRDQAKGDLPALVLAVLNKQSLHVYGIARKVERLSDDALKMRKGILFTRRSSGRCSAN